MKELDKLIADALEQDAKATKGPWLAKRHDRKRFESVGPIKWWAEYADDAGIVARVPDIAWVTSARTREPKLARLLRAAMAVVYHLRCAHTGTEENCLACRSLAAFDAAAREEIGEST